MPPPPELILLDLNLPGMDGREVLSHIRSNPTLKSIPVVILTTSKAMDDVQRCYQLGANTYLQKPQDIDELFKMMAAIKAYWFRMAELPRA